MIVAMLHALSKGGQNEAIHFELTRLIKLSHLIKSPLFFHLKKKSFRFGNFKRISFFPSSLKIAPALYFLYAGN